jgi:hypothetical protein
MATALWAAKGQGEDGVWLLASWRSSSAGWRRKWWTRWLGRLQRLSQARRKSPTRMTATGHGRVSGHVWRVATVVLMLWAEAEVKRSDEATGRARALARPCVASVHALASLGVLGAYGAGQCEPLLGQGLAWSLSGESGDSPGHGGGERRGKR